MAQQLLERYSTFIWQMERRKPLYRIQTNDHHIARKLKKRLNAKLCCYGVFELKRLQRDFPTLVEFFKDDRKEVKIGKGTTLSGTTNSSYKAMLNIIKA